MTALAMLVDEHLRTFAAKIGFDGALGLDEHGFCALSFGDEDPIIVGIEVVAEDEEEESLLFHAKVADLGGGDFATQSRLLELNLYGRGTGGGALGLDPGTGEVVVTFTWGFPDLEYWQFEALLETAYVAVARIRAVLASAAPAGGQLDLLESAGGGDYFVIR
jgi:hypothetical protein